MPTKASPMTLGNQLMLFALVHPTRKKPMGKATEPALIRRVVEFEKKAHRSS